MTIILTLILCLVLAYTLNKEYEPRIDIVLQERKRAVLLWYNKEGKRTYKHLFNF